jgi:hypothetical protein
LSENTMGYALKHQVPTPVLALGCEVARRLKRNGVLHWDWARGRVVAVDGIGICNSLKTASTTIASWPLPWSVPGFRSPWGQAPKERGERGGLHLSQGCFSRFVPGRRSRMRGGLLRPRVTISPLQSRSAAWLEQGRALRIGGGS